MTHSCSKGSARSAQPSHLPSHSRADESGGEPKIVTDHVYPPIPLRSFDWCAYVEGSDEETRICGWGATKEAAIRDLRLISEDFPRRCLTNIVDGLDGSCWHCNAAQGETCRDPDLARAALTPTQEK